MVEIFLSKSKTLCHRRLVYLSTDNDIINAADARFELDSGTLTTFLEPT